MAGSVEAPVHGRVMFSKEKIAGEAAASPLERDVLWNGRGQGKQG